MEPTTPPSPASPLPSETDVAAEVRSLKSLFYLALLGLIVMGIALNIFLGKQMRLARSQLFSQQKALDESERLVANFAVTMNSFASTNKDFQAIFDKYRPVFADYISGPGSAGPRNP